EAAKESSVESRNLMPGEDAGRGLAASFPKPPEKTGMVELPPPKNGASKGGDDKVEYVGPPSVDRDDEALRQEAEQERRKKREAYYSGLGANIMVHRSGSPTQTATPAPGGAPGSPQTAERPQSAGPDGYDPAADIDKEGFFQRADTNQWRSPYTREAGLKYELKTGTVIPGMMVTGINSDLPGNIIAQVSQNVYDTATGNHVLIPQGAKIYGAYDSRVTYGQQRVLVAWNRIVFPDGSSVTLGAMPGSDLAGYAGFADELDKHYFRIFGSAFLMSLITGGMSYAMDKVDNNNNSGENSTSMQDEMASALAAQMGQTAMKMMEKNMSIKPTIGIRPGYRFNIVVTKDVAFRGPYVAWR
ncbi:hypothetical protein LJB86_03070, partial [Deltaproteobacteria bacterium OttesenSCG-928-M10]|nr:hypothetical protein [Deltaproteobacteria bacterium OttesenSCG-928-M10]